jgi:hypothetical protein
VYGSSILIRNHKVIESGSNGDQNPQQTFFVTNLKKCTVSKNDRFYFMFLPLDPDPQSHWIWISSRSKTLKCCLLFIHCANNTPHVHGSDPSQVKYCNIPMQIRPRFLPVSSRTFIKWDFHQTWTYFSPLPCNRETFSDPAMAWKSTNVEFRELYGIVTGLAKTRVFFFKPNLGGFFWVLLGFLGFIEFFKFSS